MSFAVQRHLNAVMPLRAPVVSTALFAPPNVGPPAFVTHFNALVNSRRIAFEYDIVPQVGGQGVCMGVEWRGIHRHPWGCATGRLSS